MEVFREVEKSLRGEEEHFEGTVWLQEMLPPIRPSRLRASPVTFEPGARTNWHSHPEFQILFVIGGKGHIRSSYHLALEE